MNYFQFFVNLFAMKKYFGSFPVPRQHGAWAMFLVPAIMAATLADRWRWSSLFLILAFILIFLSHQPAIHLLRRFRYQRKIEKQSLFWVILLGGSGFVIAGVLFIWFRQWIAMMFGGIVGVAFLIHLWLTMNKEHMSIPGEIVGVFGLTASAPTLYLFLHGSLDARGWVLWMINFLYFTGSIFYVKLKLRVQPRLPEPGLKGKIKVGTPVISYSFLVLIYVLIVTLIRGYSWFFFLAYVPFFIKVIVGTIQWQDRKSLKINRFGFTELIHAIVFFIFSLAGFHYTI